MTARWSPPTTAGPASGLRHEEPGPTGPPVGGGPPPGVGPGDGSGSGNGSSRQTWTTQPRSIVAAGASGDTRAGLSRTSRGDPQEEGTNRRRAGAASSGTSPCQGVVHAGRMELAGIGNRGRRRPHGSEDGLRLVSGAYVVFSDVAGIRQRRLAGHLAAASRTRGGTQGSPSERRAAASPGPMS